MTLNFPEEKSVCSEVYTNSSFSCEFIQQLNHLRANKKFFDVVIQVQDFSISCHKVVLASSSYYFRTMFTGCMKESWVNKVTMHDVQPSILKSLIDYCYTGTILITEDNVVSLIKSADLFQFSKVVEACCRFMSKHLHPSNCVGIWNFSISMNFKTLIRECVKYAIKCIVDIAYNGDLENLSSDQMSDVLSSSELNVDKEETAYELLLTWFRVDLIARRNSFCKLLKCIRLPFIRRIYMLSKIETNPYIRKSISCQSLIRETKLFHSCMIGPQDKVSVKLQPRPSTGIGELLIVVGGCDDDCDATGMVRSYNKATGQWRVLATWNEHLCGGFSLVGLGNDLYVTGGSDGSVVYNSLWRYRTQLNEWQKLSPMLRPRDYHASAVLNSLIFVVGNEGCECYDFLLDRWTPVSPMCVQASNISLAACGSHLYCVGSSVPTNDIILQMYSPAINKWELLPVQFPADMSLFAPQIISLQQLLYFIREDSKKVLTLDPKTLKWRYDTADMNMVHMGGAISTYDGNLVVSGGYDRVEDRYKLTGRMEVYRVEGNRWEAVGSEIPQPTFWHQTSSVYRYVEPPRGQSFKTDASIHHFPNKNYQKDPPSSKT